MARAAQAVTQAQIDRIVTESQPERLSDPGKRPIAGDHVAHVVQLVGWGQSALAADHLLFPELTGALPAVVGGILRQLTLRFVDARLRGDEPTNEVVRKVRQRQYCYEAALETAV